MSGFDDRIAVMGDLIPTSPSPRGFFTSMISDDATEPSIMDSGTESKSWPTFPGRTGPSEPGNSDQNDQTQGSGGDDKASNQYGLAEPKLSSCGGLKERIAARAGFNAPRLNTESIRPADLSKKPDVRSPYLSISPGLSPSILLDSPVFVTNSLAFPSPTTGKLSHSPSGNNLNSTLTGNPDEGKKNTFEDANASTFTFKPVAESASFHYFNTTNKPFPGVVVSTHSDTSLPLPSIEPPKVHPENDSALFQQANFSESHEGKSRGGNLLPEQTYNSIGVADHSSPFDDFLEDGEQRSSGDPKFGSFPADDGYNWRKYGQKHVKGSEYPRSYYKCTHPNCPVKKKVERSYEGHITEIIYRAAHNHPKPPPNHRSALGPSNAPGDMQLDSEQHGVRVSADCTWPIAQNGNFGGASDWRSDNLQSTIAAPSGEKYGNRATTNLQAQSRAQYESGDAVDGSFTFSNDEEEDDRATYASVSLGNEGEGDELESKRRRTETYAPEMGGASRSIREPRVVVQTTSDVDILDDGYRWRKYGQKVVKGNPNPRSYYKCTSEGCNVRKHVERASHDLRSVITTYEGKHIHDVPAARNSGHANSGGPNALPRQQAASNRAHRPEPPSQIRVGSSLFERPSMGPFGIQGMPQLGPCPGFGFGFGTNRPSLADMGLGGLAPGHGKFPVLPVNPYFGHQPHPAIDVGYVLPKGEPKLEPLTDAGLHPPDASSIVYQQQLMSRLPLGPQM